MDVSVFQDVNLLREVGAFAFVAGALVFLAWEAWPKLRGAGQAPGSTKRIGHAGPAVAGALAGAAILAERFQLTAHFWG